MDSDPSKIDLPTTLGVIEIGIILNAFLFGVVTLQMFTYYSWGFKDSWKIHILLWWTYILDLVYTAISVEMLWAYTVTGFGSFEILGSARWEYLVLPVFISGASVPIQLFLALRIKAFIHNRFGTGIFILIALLSLTQGAIAIQLTTNAFQVGTSASSLDTTVTIGKTYSVINLCTDLMITICLVASLWCRRTGSKTTDNIIIRIITTTVETAIPVSLFAIGHIISVTVSGVSVGVPEMFVLPIARLYSNTLLVTLNSRGKIRSNMMDVKHGLTVLNNTHTNVFGDTRISGLRFAHTTNDQSIHVHNTRNDTVEMNLSSYQHSKDVESGSSNSNSI